MFEEILLKRHQLYEAKWFSRTMSIHMYTVKKCVYVIQIIKHTYTIYLLYTCCKTTSNKMANIKIIDQLFTISPEGYAADVVKKFFFGL